MGRRGPAPEPRELREAKGNPGRRPLPAPVLVGERVAPAAAPPEPPDGLDEYARPVWVELARLATEGQLLTLSDLAVLEGLAVQVGRARQAREQLAGQPLAVEGAQSQWIVNPLVRVERDAWTLALKIAKEFGMTPSARASLGLTLNLGRSVALDVDARINRRIADVPKTLTVSEAAAPKPAGRRRKTAAASGSAA